MDDYWIVWSSNKHGKMSMPERTQTTQATNTTGMDDSGRFQPNLR